MGILSQVFFDYSGEMTEMVPALSVHAHRALSALLFAVGVALDGALRDLHRERLSAARGSPLNYLGIAGLLLIIGGFMTFTFTLPLHAHPGRRKSDPLISLAPRNGERGPTTFYGFAAAGPR